MKGKTAVALRYVRDLPAPFVVARGKGELAEKLTAIAASHDIPIRNEGELAEALYGVEVGALIPEPFYRVVAELLAAVMSERGDRGSSEEHQGQ
jgi:type III secretion system FlhB-like substrate exporter